MEEIRDTDGKPQLHPFAQRVCAWRCRTTPKKDRLELVGLDKQTARLVCRPAAAERQHLEPVCRFVRFLRDHTDTGNELGLRSGPARGPVIRGYPVRRPQQLLSEIPAAGIVGQFVDEAHRVEGKRFRPLFQLF